MADRTLDRQGLYNEFHARPFASLTPPERASHFAVLTDREDADGDRRYLHSLCDRYGVPHPAGDANHFQADLGPVRLKWERHTEFATYTFFRSGGFQAPFSEVASSHVDAALLSELNRSLVVGTHVAILDPESPEPSIDQLADWFVVESLCGSGAGGGAAQVWTDYHIHADGFGRILIRNVEMGPRQVGRLVQRLLEIDTYRVLAMMALPIARENDPRITAIEESVSRLTGRMNEVSSLEDENDLLRELTDLSGRVEESSARTAFRFGAARAYDSLVEERTQQLRETRVGGLQTIAEFMARRLAPAMRTCAAVAARQESLAERIERASNLLRTRVDLALERQNRDLLASMDRRARLQLRLQQTVEGLSVAAITYYVVSLVGYATPLLRPFGVWTDEDLIRGAAIPVVALLVWAGVRWARKRLVADEEADRH